MVVYTPVTEEAEAEESKVQGRPLKLGKNLSQKVKKGLGIIAQLWCTSGFSPQYYKR